MVPIERKHGNLYIFYLPFILTGKDVSYRFWLSGLFLPAVQWIQKEERWCHLFSKILPQPVSGLDFVWVLYLLCSELVWTTPFVLHASGRSSWELCLQVTQNINVVQQQQASNSQISMLFGYSSPRLSFLSFPPLHLSPCLKMFALAR